jgi:hypothetical protein
VLALLLGLVGGVALAALIESVRPTVIGSAAVAHEFDAPLLETLRSSPEDQTALASLEKLQTRLSLAAGSALAPSVALVGTGPSIDLRPLAARLDRTACQAVAPVRTPVFAGHQDTPQMTGAKTTQRRRAEIRVFASAPGGTPSPNGRGIGGVVVVAPTSLKIAEVEETRSLLRIMPASLLGVVTYPRPKRPRSRPTLASTRAWVENLWRRSGAYRS